MAFHCPTCTRTFETRRGLGVHHTSVHDEQLPNRTCDHCGTEFSCEYDKRFCSDSCLESAGVYAGSNNPNYRGGKEATDCERCGREFRYYPSEKPGKYCASCVESGGWRYRPSLIGEENPRWSGGMRQEACHRCGARIERYPSGFNSEHVFCGNDCRSRWLSREFTGPGHPNFKGGPIGSYGKGWAETRRQARERDENACVVCGTTKGELGRNLDVHHFLPVRAFLDSPVLDVSDAHYLGNVVTLCPPCHRRAERGDLSETTLREAAGLVSTD